MSGPVQSGNSYAQSGRALQIRYLDELIFFFYSTFFYRRWKGDYLNDTAENQFYDAYRSALMKDGINQKSVLFSAPVKKFNRHGKVCRFVLFSKRGRGYSDMGAKSDSFWHFLSIFYETRSISFFFRGNFNDAIRFKVIPL